MRTNLSYMDSLMKFHQQQGEKSLNKLPQVNHKPLDLFKLKCKVTEFGGYEKVYSSARYCGEIEPTISNVNE